MSKTKTLRGFDLIGSSGEIIRPFGGPATGFRQVLAQGPAGLAGEFIR